MNTYETALRTAGPTRSGPWRSVSSGDGPRRLTAALDRWAFFRHVFEGARDGIGIVDRSMRVVVWNGAASQMTGVPMPEALGAACEIDGNRLTLDCAGARGAVDHASFVDTGVRLCSEVSARTCTGLRVSPDVVAAIVPLRTETVGFLLHLSRRPSPRTTPDVRTPGLRRPDAVTAGSGGEAGVASLTPRERHVLALLASGRTAKPIAAELSLSLPTVRTHIQHILQKLSVHSCLEAVCLLRNRMPPAAGAPAGADVPSSAARFP